MKVQFQQNKQNIDEGIHKFLPDDQCIFRRENADFETRLTEYIANKLISARSGGADAHQYLVESNMQLISDTIEIAA